ncbi:unnamed protein product [Orchesella dallaii]|uniref:Probable RNA polymerase II nuclear localization protein SLC7A6OS n=1 Tax=Orchesella dallaii TaxID=48710 RepID=A0ABP1QJ54_9HEXA
MAGASGRDGASEFASLLTKEDADGDGALEPCLGGMATPLTIASVVESPVRQTVIRLKRRIEDSPSKILLVSYKRSKTDANIDDEEAGTSGKSITSASDGVVDNDAYTQVLRLVGTVPECEADTSNIASTVKNVLATQPLVPKVAIRRNVKGNVSKITEKSRERFKKGSEDGRFKMVSSRRGVDLVDETNELDNKSRKGWSAEDNHLLKLLDLVPESDIEGPRKRSKPAGFEPGNITCNGVPMIKGKDDETGFVYDLYLANDPCIEEFTFGRFLSVEEADDDIFMDYRDNEGENERFEDDDDDSNAEDNWRNDYPDSDEGELQDDNYGGAGHSQSCGDETGEVYGMRFKGLNMNGQNGESSSDEDCIYGIEDDGANYGIDNFDASYARYKNKLRKYGQDYEDEVVSVSSDSD